MTLEANNETAHKCKHNTTSFESQSLFSVRKDTVFQKPIYLALKQGKQTQHLMLASELKLSKAMFHSISFYIKVTFNCLPLTSLICGQVETIFPENSCANYQQFLCKKINTICNQITGTLHKQSQVALTFFLNTLLYYVAKAT